MLHMAGAANRSLDGAEESCGQLLARMLLLGARAADKALEACLGPKTRAGVARRSSWSSVPPTVAPEQLAVDIDNEAGLQAIKSVQRCYRGKLGRRSVVALSEEVTMSSQLDIKVDDDDQVTHVNDYAMNGVLGQGAYGIVYRAKGVLDPHARGDVAIKVLNRSVLKRKKMGKGTAFDGVLKEISVMKTLCHPNCVQLFEVIDDKTHDCMYLVMEFVAGGDLAAPINRKEHVPEALMRGWMRDAVLGLEHLHSYSILHRDIKPENILWDAVHKRAKLADFGVSSISEGGQHKDYVRATAGTPAFYAPEMCGDDKTGSRVYSGRAADIWALGVCVYMWMFHRLPFEAPTVFMLMEAIRDGELQLDTQAYEATPELLELLRGLLAKKPQHRLRIKDLRRSAWLTDGRSEPLPVPQNMATGHQTVHKGELQEILKQAVTQIRVENKFKQASQVSKSTGKRFLEKVKPAAPPPAAAAPPGGAPRRHPGMLKR